LIMKIKLWNNIREFILEITMLILELAGDWSILVLTLVLILNTWTYLKDWFTFKNLELGLMKHGVWTKILKHKKMFKIRKIRKNHQILRTGQTLTQTTILLNTLARTTKM
jgi:hypothetical protein